jgi:hypothetical protein
MANKPLFKAVVTQGFTEGDDVVYIPMGRATAWNNDGQKSISLELAISGKMVRCSFLIPSSDASKPASKAAKTTSPIDDEESPF